MSVCPLEAPYVDTQAVKAVLLSLLLQTTLVLYYKSHDVVGCVAFTVEEQFSLVCGTTRASSDVVNLCC